MKENKRKTKIFAEIFVRIRSSLYICNVTHVRYTRLYLVTMRRSRYDKGWI